MYRDSIITNFPLILTVKRFENWSIFDYIIRGTKSVPIFWITLYVELVNVQCLW